MGAAPSREVTTHSLPRSPFYGQRQQVVLIPLLKDFFPSADCPLFQQFYEARCDPAVRYYHYAQEGSAAANPSAYRYPEGCGGGPVEIACSPANVFPTAPSSPDELYRVYIEEGGEKMVYETDEAMLKAYQADPKSIRPMPCAVAFYYPTSDGSSPTPKGAEKSTAAAVGSAETSAGTGAIAERKLSAPSGGGGDAGYVEGCVVVLGCQVKMTGFVGDISRLLGSQALSTSGEANTPNAIDPADGYEMDLYLTKSAGDHNRTHVLLSAIYTYAEQWQRACLRYSAEQDREGQDRESGVSASTSPADGCQGEERSAAPLSRAYPTVRIGSEVYDTARIFAASTSAYYKQFMRVATSPEILCSLFSPKEEATGVNANDDIGQELDGTEHGGSAGEAAVSRVPAVKMLEWASPPLAAVRMRGRRTNVPLLCFLREIRGILLGIHAATARCTASASTAAQDADTPASGIDGLDREGSIRSAALKDLILWLEEVLPSAQDGQGDGTPPPHDGSDTIDTLLNVYASSHVVQMLMEHSMNCLLHNLNPQEILRALDPRHHGRPRIDKGGTEESAEAEQDQQDNRLGPSNTRSLSLRLPAEDFIVEPWPPVHARLLSGGGAAVTSSSPLVDLDSLRDYLPDKHLYWIVGTTDAARRSAMASLLHWRRQGNPVLVSYDTDESHEPHLVSEAPADLDDALRALKAVPDRDVWHGDGNGGEEVPALLDAGLAIELQPVAIVERGQSKTSSQGPQPSCSGRVLRVCRLPLEEALLGELSDACKQAREAGPLDEHWVRSEAQRAVSEAEVKSVEEQRSQLVKQYQEKGESYEAAVAAASANMEVYSRPPEAMDIVGDGCSCLYRVVLASSAARIIAVTPFFLKIARKKAKKKTPGKSRSGFHGTAINVFYIVNEPAAKPIENKREPAPDDTGSLVSVTGRKDESTKTGTASQSAEGAHAPEEAREETPAVQQQKPVAAEADPPPLSKAQRKKANRKAAAATAAAEAAAAEGETSRAAPEAPTKEQQPPNSTASTAKSKTSKNDRKAKEEKEKPPHNAVESPEVDRKAAEPDNLVPGAGLTAFSSPPAVSPPAPPPVDANLKECERPPSAAGSSFTPPLPQHRPPPSSTPPPYTIPPGYGTGGAAPYMKNRSQTNASQPPPPPPAPPQHDFVHYHHCAQQPSYQPPMGPGAYGDPSRIPPQPSPPSTYYANQPPPPPWTSGGYNPLPPPPNYFGPVQGSAYGGAPTSTLPFSHPYVPPPPDAVSNPEMLSYPSAQHQPDAYPRPRYQAPPVPRSVAAAAAAAAAGKGARAEYNPPPPLPNANYVNPQPHPSQHRDPLGEDSNDMGQYEPPAFHSLDANSGHAYPRVDMSTSAGGVMNRHVSFDVNAASSKSHLPDGSATSMPPFFPPDSTLHVRVASSATWERSSNSQLVFYPDDINSPITTDSANFPATRPNLEASMTTSNNDGAGSSGAAGVHVTVVRRRTHHHHHTRTGSYFSESTTNDGGGSVSQASGPSKARVYVSHGSNAETQAANMGDPQQPPGASGSSPAMPSMAQGPSSAEGQPEPGSSQAGRQPTTNSAGAAAAGAIPDGGVASSTRSGDTGASGAKHQMRSGKYRWDWRSVNIDYVDED